MSKHNLRPVITTKFDYNKPSIIFTIGPTGSGKSKLLNKTVELIYHNKTIPPFKTFLIDDYVESSYNYKTRINSIIDKYNCKTSIESGTCDIENPSQDLLTDFADSYMSVRKDGPCQKSGDGGCNNLFDVALTKATNNKENIVFETTGMSIPTWLLDFPTIKQADYNVIFVYSIVNFDELIRRNISRAKQSLKEYIADNNINAPRLPNISPDVFKATTKHIMRTLDKLRNICLRIGRPPIDSGCGSINSGSKFILLIFDNNSATKNLIYDSRTTDMYMTDIEFKTLLFSYNLSGGHIKLLKKK